jgi:hypothetical protein
VLCSATNTEVIIEYTLQIRRGFANFSDFLMCPFLLFIILHFFILVMEANESNFDDDDTHICLKCQITFIGLDNYILHRRSKCTALNLGVPTIRYNNNMNNT